MSESLKHKCAVAAFVELDPKRKDIDVVPDGVEIIKQLQNRGDLGTGMGWIQKNSNSGNRIGIHTGAGKAEEVLSSYQLIRNNIHSHAAIFHNRYATDSGCFHPIHFDDPEFAFAFNGNIGDYSEELKFLKEQGITPRMEGDTELMGQLLLWAMREYGRNDMARVFSRAFRTLEGSFNPVVLTKKAVYGLRDRMGRHPLTWAQRGSQVAIASEDIAIRTLWPNAEVHDVKPGHMIEINMREQQVETHQLWRPQRKGCFIEKVYFADHRSRIDGVSVSNTRYECGEILAEQDIDWITEKWGDKPIEKHPIVVPVPESGKTASRAVADYIDLVANVEAIKRNKEVGRSFIKRSQAEREAAADKKYSFDKKLLKDRPVILVDDSMVRGTTMRRLVANLRKNGATEVHVRLASPPILGPCFYGIDFPTVTELIARKHAGSPDVFQADGTLPQDVLDAIAKDIGADSIKFLPLEKMARAMGEKDESSICMSCVTCQHDGPKGQALYELALKNAEIEPENKPSEKTTS